MTKKQQGIYHAYCNSNTRSIYEAYKNPSAAKVRAFDYCMRVCAEMGGMNPRITGANTSAFSFAFMYEKDGVSMLHYETHMNTYDFVIE